MLSCFFLFINLISLFRHARYEPGSAEPHLHAPIDLSFCQGFLLLMSDGLYDAYKTWTRRPECVNEDIAHLVAKELKNCRASESMAAQNVVEKIKFLYHDMCKKTSRTGRLDDLTLIVKGIGASVFDSVPQTAPPSSRHFEFGNPHPTVLYHQPSAPSYLHYQHPRSQTSLQHQLRAPHMARHHFPPSVQQQSFLSSSHPLPSTMHQREYADPSGTWNIDRGVEVNEPAYFRQQTVPHAFGVPEGGDYYHRNRQSHQEEQWQAELRRRDRDGAHRNPADRHSFTRVSSVPQSHANHPAGERNAQLRHSYCGPHEKHLAGDRYGPPADQGPVPSTHQVKFQLGSDVTAPYPSGQGNQDISTTTVSNPNQNVSSISDTSTAPPDVTPIVHPPSMPATGGGNTSNQGDIQKLGGPSEMKSDSNLVPPGSQPPEESKPQTLEDALDCYVMVSDGDDTEEEEEQEQEQPDGSDMLKPYVKFNERFPSDISWYDIETSS